MHSIKRFLSPDFFPYFNLTQSEFMFIFVVATPFRQPGLIFSCLWSSITLSHCRAKQLPRAQLCPALRLLVSCRLELVAGLYAFAAGLSAVINTNLYIEKICRYQGLRIRIILPDPDLRLFSSGHRFAYEHLLRNTVTKSKKMFLLSVFGSA